MSGFLPPEGIRLNSINFVAITHRLSEELKKGKNFRLRIDPWQEKRSLSQNAMFHAWMNELSRYLITRGRPYCSPEWCKDAMKYTFLGMEEITFTNVETGAQIVRESVRQTSKLKAGEMFHFMTKVQAWCLDIGCILSVSETSEFFALSRKQEE